MSSEDEIEEIRQRKREKLREQHRTGGGNAGDGDEPPAEPIAVDGIDEFERLLDRYDVVLADFYADWCGPCRMFEPVIEEVARDTEAAVLKVDTDAHPQLAARQGARSLPTVVVYADGEPAERLVGVQDKPVLVDLIRRVA